MAANRKSLVVKFGQFVPALKLKQEIWFKREGEYWQGLRQPTIPNGKDLADMDLKLSPRDRAGRDFEMFWREGYFEKDEEGVLTGRVIYDLPTSALNSLKHLRTSVAVNVRQSPKGWNWSATMTYLERGARSVYTRGRDETSGTWNN